MTRIKKSLSVLALSGALVAGGMFGTNLFQNVQFTRAQAEVKTSREQLATATDLAAAFKEVGKAVEPSVVSINVRKTVTGVSRRLPFDDDLLRRFFGDRDNNGEPDVPDGHPQVPGRGDNGGGTSPGPDGAEGFEQIGTGSGVIMEVSGDTAWILTNNHVAGGADEMIVTLADGRQIKGGKTAGTDPKTDIALVKLKVSNVIPARWGDSQQLQKGDWIMAFGSPFGYVGSMTHGIVSALNREVGILRTQQGYENFIQVDAPINPGNSGGPLVNLKGEVVGINTAIASRSGGFQGVGFAIPSSQAKFVYAQLKDKGKVTRGWLGVSIASVDDPRVVDLAKSFGYDDANGVLVQEVMPNTPAAGKLQEGDIITRIDGKQVRDASTLRNIIAAESPNSEVTMSVFRDGKTSDVKIKLGEQPENLRLARNRSGGKNGGAAEAKPDSIEAAGLKLADITDEAAQRFNLGDNKKGALVTSVDPKSIAAKEGIRPGDVITKVGGKPVNTAAEAKKLLGKEDIKKGVRLYVTTPDGSRFVFLKQDE